MEDKNNEFSFKYVEFEEQSQRSLGDMSVRNRFVDEVVLETRREDELVPRKQKMEKKKKKKDISLVNCPKFTSWSEKGPNWKLS